MKNTKPLSPISSSFHRAWFLFEHYFPKILFAIAIPIIIGSVLLWTAFGVTLMEIKQTASYEQLLSIFSLSSPTAYMLLLAAVAGFIVQIIGLIAGPLVMIEHETIKIKDIFPRAFTYFFRYLRFIILVAGAVTVLFLISYLLITIISVIAGMISFNYIEPTLNVLSAIIPNLALLGIVIFFIFSPFMLIQSNQGAYQAIVLSTVYVKNNFWGLVLRLIIVMMCVFVVSVALSFIPYIGVPLSALVSSCLMTVYTYVLYEDVMRG
ncbi:MAG: hypothetical protein ACD_43C00008G0004 [uncultured bacterium]|nr:MAG: hypothetical protein ACD_43C00008G0004 [uncultured bacterium]